MMLVPVTNEVIARLEADTTLTAIATGGIYAFRGPPTGQDSNTEAPYIVVSMTFAEPAEPAQRTQGYRVTVVVDSYIRAETATAYTKINSMMLQINGNATKRSDFSPTYGLHNFQLPNNTAGWDEWKVGPLAADVVSLRATDDTDWLQATQTFDLQVTRVCPTS